MENEKYFVKCLECNKNMEWQQITARVNVEPIEGELTQTFECPGCKRKIMIIEKD